MSIIFTKDIMPLFIGIISGIVSALIIKIGEKKEKHNLAVFKIGQLISRMSDYIDSIKDENLDDSQCQITLWQYYMEICVEGQNLLDSYQLDDISQSLYNITKAKDYSEIANLKEIINQQYNYLQEHSTYL